MRRWGAGAAGALGAAGGARAAATDVDLREALEVCREDPVASVLAAARLEAALADGAVRGGPNVWGVRRDGRLAAVCWAGANLVPVARPGDEEALDAIAATALRQGRRCSSLVGDAAVVLPLWRRLESSWGPAREVRARQPSLLLDGPPAVAPDPLVRPARPDELAVVLPACVRMFEEEVGYSPLEGGGTAYESRVRALVSAGRSYVRTVRGPRGPEVLFKAEVGAVALGVAQVQGVWVAPARRGEGLAAPGIAAVARLASGLAPAVSLYVNDYNTRALGAYRRAGFREVGTYATVLF